MSSQKTEGDVMSNIEQTCGPYTLIPSTVGEGFVIRRQDADHARTVAFVDTVGEWFTFVGKLHEGYSETGAVLSIDA